MFVKILILTLFFAMTVAVGIYCRKKASSVGDFVLGGRKVGPWLTAFAYGTSYFSAVVFVGYAGQFGWNFGISATWIGVGNALLGSLLAWLFLGRRTRVMTQHFESATMPDFFAKRFCCPSLKIAASILIFVFLVPYSASVYKGLSGLFSAAFHIDFLYCIVAMAILTAVYVILGGYMAAAINDFIQGIIMLVGIIAVVISVLAANGGLFASIDKLSQLPADTTSAVPGAFASLLGPDPWALLSVVILTSLGTWGLPQMVHKFYTIKDEKAIRTGMVISTVFAFIIAGGSYFIGGFGRLFYTPENGVVAFDQIVPGMLSAILPDLLIGIVIVLVLSASMSTLSSLVITSSSTFTLDFLQGTIFKQMRPKVQIFTIKFLCAVFVLLSVLLAINPNNLISGLMSLSWGTLAGAFLGPFLYGLFWKGTTNASVWVSMIFAIVLNVGNLFFPLLSPTMAGALSIVGSLVVVPIVSLVTPKLSASSVQSAFSCFEKQPNCAASRADACITQ